MSKLAENYSVKNDEGVRSYRAEEKWVREVGEEKQFERGKELRRPKRIEKKNDGGVTQRER